MAQKPQENRPEKKKTRVQIVFSLLARFAAALLTVAMLFAALMVVIHRDNLTLDPIRRWVNYGSIHVNEEGKTEEYAFSGDSSNSFASLSGGLLVCSRSALQVYSDTGESVVNLGVSMNAPIIDVVGEHAVVYDVGGNQLYQFTGTQKVFEYTPKGNGRILAARVNSSGYLSVVEQTAGHEASVTIYDNTHRARIGINETSNYVTDAIISPNNHFAALIEIYQNEGRLDTNLVIYRLSDAHVFSTCKLEDEMVLDMKWDNDRIWLQRESGITVCDAEGTILGSWNDNAKYLEGYSLDGSQYAVELVSRYKSGSAGDLRIIDKDGQQVVSRRVNEEVLSVSAAGNYIAVLTTGSLTVYQDDLQLYASVANSTARRIIMREDGSVLMIGSETARLFLP